MDFTKPIIWTCMSVFRYDMAALAIAYRIQVAISKQASTAGDDAPLGGDALSASPLVLI
jgi:hypothetical protein